MTQWNVPYQESLGSLKQHRQTCTNMLLCLWRGKALMEIIGLLGSDISKCAICFPSLPSLMVFETIPIPRPPAAAVLYDKIHPSLILSLSFFLSLCNDRSVDLLSFWLCDAGVHWGHRAEQLWNHSTQIWHSCENTHLGMSVSFKIVIDFVDCVWFFTPFPFWNSTAEQIIVISHLSNIWEKQILVVVWLIIVTGTWMWSLRSITCFTQI